MVDLHNVILYGSLKTIAKKFDKYAKEQTPIDILDIIEFSAIRGDVEIFEYIWLEFCDYWNRWEDLIFITLCKYGELKILERFYKNIKLGYKATKIGFIAASSNGHLEVLQFIIVTYEVLHIDFKKCSKNKQIREFLTYTTFYDYTKDQTTLISIIDNFYSDHTLLKMRKQWINFRPNIKKFTTDVLFIFT